MSFHTIVFWLHTLTAVQCVCDEQLRVGLCTGCKVEAVGKAAGIVGSGKESLLRMVLKQLKAHDASIEQLPRQLTPVKAAAKLEVRFALPHMRCHAAMRVYFGRWCHSPLHGPTPLSWLAIPVCHQSCLWYKQKGGVGNAPSCAVLECIGMSSRKFSSLVAWMCHTYSGIKL